MRSAACVLVERPGGYVLAVRCKHGGWSLPGGKVEPGESEAFAARRECVEETGFDPGSLLRRTPYVAENADGVWLTRVYRVPESALVRCTVPEPGRDPTWMPWEALTAGPYGSYIRRMRWALAGHP